ncbi:hypothetical protein Clacol_007336 [Clathrus columnatus]|uniref:Poly [ADP-ribose] polymerase n=1 Tax=Clathrus columnatus TaxID=1419009 RepID=A0AAV5AKW5_9AGAM|nr:hypothetical protein Clacol_007336 [Clathrus columnatus]
MPPKRSKPKSSGTAATVQPSTSATVVTGGKHGLHGSSSDSENDGGPVTKKVKKDTSNNANMVTVVKRNSVPIDPHSGCSVYTHRIYQDQGDVWDAMLNQTNISSGTNSNKFYVLQLLQEEKNHNSVVLFTRWGRVGEVGATQTKGPWPGPEAITHFKKQFKAKTGTDWDKRQAMISKKGKYVLIERDFENEPNNSVDDASASASAKKEVQIRQSKLVVEVQKAHHRLLGKLAKTTIVKGFEVLKELAEVIEDPSGKWARQGGINEVCAELSSRYYSFGRNRPTIISHMSLLKHELEVLDNLGDMEIAHRIISSSMTTDEDGNIVNPLDMHFQSLGLSFMDPVARGSKEFDVLQAYVHDTHGNTHSWYKVNVQHIFRVGRDNEVQAFREAGYDKLETGQRLLLWHGSRSTNFAGILKQGLRIAPPEAPVSGYMFGKGVYLADMMSKSANYCYPQLSNGTGLLLLCEAAVKPFNELRHADFTADDACKKNGALATKGLGRFQHVDWQDAGKALNRPELLGVDMPKGCGSDVNQADLSLQYNEVRLSILYRLLNFPDLSALSDNGKNGKQRLVRRKRISPFGTDIL